MNSNQHPVKIQPQNAAFTSPLLFLCALLFLFEISAAKRASLELTAAQKRRNIQIGVVGLGRLPENGGGRHGWVAR